MNRFLGLLTVLALTGCLSGPALAQSDATSLGDSFNACIQLDSGDAGVSAVTLRLTFNVAAKSALTGDTVFSVIGFSLDLGGQAMQASMYNGAAAVVGDQLEVSLTSNDVSVAAATSGHMLVNNVHLLVGASSMDGAFTMVKELVGPDHQESTNFYSGTVTAISCF